jgi:4-diphosphocytidyl-2-C-methyl-D-erythritol kinase
MDTLVVPAPAKLNLFLHVTGRRPDGYHELDTLFVALDYGDTVTLVLRADGAIQRTAENAGVPAEADLAVRAARALQKATGTRLGVDLAIEKRIPIGGGLGGGSSDAASVLLALNRLWRTGCSRRELMTLGRTLGADVPFFIGGVAALGRGIGDRLVPVSVPPRWYAVVAPKANVPTAEIFAAPDLTRTTPSAKMEVFSESYGRNDLQPVAVARHPAIAETLKAWREHAPQARMTGSGGCVFASFGTEDEAIAAFAARPAGTGGFVARNLAVHPLAALA